MLKTYGSHGSLYLTWGWHDLASSRRSEGVGYPIFAKSGIDIDMIYSQKTAGRHRLPNRAKYLLKRYWTGRCYPKHILYEIVRRSLEVIGEFDKETTFEEIDQMELPELLKEWICEDLFR